jgi:undecaprenyl pyrophosphate synthase
MKHDKEPLRNEQSERESPTKGFMDMDITFYLEEDGRVVISDLPEELLDLVKKLDPHAEIFCALDYPCQDK